MRSTAFSRLTAALLLSIVLVLGIYAVAEAHATLVASEPAAGSHLNASPSRVRLLFNEQVEPTMASLSINGADGKTVALAPTGDPHDVHAVIAPLGTLSPGAYRVTWRVISADGHPVGGSYVFTIGLSVPAAPPQANGALRMTTWGPAFQGAPIIPAVLRGLGVGTLMAVVGLLFYIMWMSASATSRPARIARWLTLAAPLLLAAHSASWIVNASPEHTLSATWWSATMQSTVGRVELWRTILSLLPLWALWFARRPTLAFWLALPALVVSASVGHSAAVDPLIAIPSKAIHLAAIAAWLGGLLWLIAREPTDRARMISETTRVSSLALVAVVAVALTGVIQTFILLRISDLWSVYGAIVGAKVLGLCILIAFGAHHRFRVIPRLAADASATHTPSSFRTTLAREITVMCVVILLGGLLSYVSPPTGDGGTNHLDSPESAS